jgi:hypothetical protein
VKLEMFNTLPAETIGLVEEEVEKLGAFLGSKAELEIGRVDK